MHKIMLVEKPTEASASGLALLLWDAPPDCTAVSSLIDPFVTRLLAELLSEIWLKYSKLMRKRCEVYSVVGQPFFGNVPLY